MTYVIRVLCVCHVVLTFLETAAMTITQNKTKRYNPKLHGARVWLASFVAWTKLPYVGPG